MSSKVGLFRAGLFSVAALAVAVSSCAVKEGPPPQKVKQFSQGDLGCLADMRQKIVEFADGQGSVAEIDRLADCTIKALRKFRDYTRGAEKDKFTAKEVRNFLQRYFLEDLVVTDELLEEIMRVKKALLGGKTEDFSVADLESTEDLVRTIRTQMIKLLPYMPMSADRLQGASAQYVDEATAVFAELAQALGDVIRRSKGSYSFSDLDRLLSEVQKIFPKIGDIDSVRKQIDFASTVKRAFISPDGSRDEVTAEDWNILLRDGTRWLGVFVKVRHLQANYDDWMRGQGRARLNSVVTEALDLFENIIDRHHGTFAFSEIDTLIDQLPWDGKVGETQYNKETLKALLRPVVRRVLGGTDLSATGRTAGGFTRPAVERIRQAFNEWSEGQRYLEGLFEGVPGRTLMGVEIAASRTNLHSVKVRDALRASGGMNETVSVVAEDLRKMIHAYPAFVDASTGKMVFSTDHADRPLTYKELSTHNWIRAIFRCLILGYMTEGNLAERARHLSDEGLSMKEFEGPILDFWQVLLDFKLVGPSNVALEDAAKRFREANLFVPAANGDDKISMDEGTYLLAFMISSVPVAHSMHKMAVENCPTGPLDEYGKKTVDAACYRALIYDFSLGSRATREIYAPYFPAMLKYYDNLSDAGQRSFRKLLEIPSRREGYSPQMFDSADTDTAAMLIHYIESMFVRFDKDGSLSISWPESQSAYLVFRKDLKKFSGMDKEKQLKAVFNWLLAYGKPPIDDKMTKWQKVKGGLAFKKWQWKGDITGKYSFSSNRSKLLSVFGAILSSGAKSPEKPKPPLLSEQLDESLAASTPADTPEEMPDPNSADVWE